MSSAQRRASLASRMRCLIDIGHLKTGSKVRQSFFANELHRIQGLRACYPRSGREGDWHQPLCEALRAGDGSLLDRAAQECASGCELAILSFERFHELRTECIAPLRDRFPWLEAYVFLRPQADLVSSLWNQRHKAHRVPFSELIEFEQRMGDYQENLDYRVVIGRWEAVLGEGRVTPLLYDKAQSPIRAFLARAGVQVDWSGYVEPRANLAVDAYALSVMRWVKRLAQPDDDLPALMTRAHEALSSHVLREDEGPARSWIGLELRERIHRHYEESNEWVRGRYFPERCRLFPPPGPVVVEPRLDTAGRDLAEAIVAGRH